MSVSYCVIIPNYNGLGIIERCLASLAWCPNVTVIDDASTDGSPEMIERTFPQVRVVRRSMNAGFSVTVNEAVRSTEGDLVVLLNSDVTVSETFLDEQLPLFADRSVFSVGPRVLLPFEDNLDEGYAVPFWHHGLLYGAQGRGVESVIPILYTTGCAAVYRRAMLESLGGLSEAYSPFYWEDVDLCYRAWKRGWKSLYQPASVVNHEHSTTISKLNADYISSVKRRNGLFFIWRNIEDKHLLRRHRMWLPLVLLRMAAVGDKAALLGWREAFKRRGDATRARVADSQHRVLSDREIFETVGVRIP